MQEKKDSITIPRWFDRHLHIRQGEMLGTVLPQTLAQQAAGAVIMPNTSPPISTIERAISYRKHIVSVSEKFFSKSGPNQSRDIEFRPRLTCYLTDTITPDEVETGFKEKIWCAGKFYPARPDGSGGTTNASHGVKNFEGLFPVIERMEKIGMPFLGHFESVRPEVDIFDREIKAFEEYAVPLFYKFPELKIVWEHVTDGRTVDFITTFLTTTKLYATITAHHLVMNRNAIFEGGLNPGHYCLPVAKREEDRLKLVKAITSGNPRFGAGTDSAPHDVLNKSRCYGCAAGIFTAPCAVELYAKVFDEENALEHFGNFMSRNFLEIYGMEPSAEMMTLERKEWRVPEMIGNIPVFWGGKTLPWKLVG